MLAQPLFRFLQTHRHHANHCHSFYLYIQTYSLLFYTCRRLPAPWPRPVAPPRHLNTCSASESMRHCGSLFPVDFPKPTAALGSLRASLRRPVSTLVSGPPVLHRRSYHTKLPETLSAGCYGRSLNCMASKGQSVCLCCTRVQS